MQETRKKTSRIDRRRATRRLRREGALVGSRKARMDRCENAVIEEISRSGLRIRSGARLRREESVVLYPNNGAQRYHLEVVWIRREGLIEKRATGRPGQAFVAGCRLKAPERKRERQKKKVARVGDGQATALVFRFLMIGAAVGLVGAIAYLLSSLLTLW